MLFIFFFFFQAEDGIRDLTVTGVQTCALPIFRELRWARLSAGKSDAERVGAMKPSSDGPSRMPAVISPTTRGWRIRAKRDPTPRVRRRTTTIWARRKDRWVTAAHATAGGPMRQVGPRSKHPRWYGTEP